MKKKLSKIFKNGRFFAHMWAQRVQCQPPDFGGPLFEDFRKIDEQKQTPRNFGFKGVPLYIQNFRTPFSHLLEGYFSKPDIFKKRGFEGSDFDQNLAHFLYHTGDKLLF